VLFVGAALLVTWIAVTSARPVIGGLLATLPPLGILTGVAVFSPAHRRAWISFGSGAALIAMGVVGFVIGDLMGHPVKAPSPLHVVLMIGLVLELVGLGGIVRGRVRLDLRDFVDVAVLVFALMVLAWFGLLDPAVDAGYQPGAELVTVLIYLIATLIFAVIVFLLLMNPGARPPSFWLLLTGVLAVLGSQIVFSYEIVRGTYRPDTLTDLGWQLAAVLIALAAVHPSMVRFSERSAEREPQGLAAGRFAMIAGAALLPPLTLLGIMADADPFDLAVLALSGAATLLMVMLRLYRAIRDLGRSMAIRQELEAELREQALRDALTGLGNRILFGRQLEVALRSDPAGVAVLYCDLDDFKTVNDTLGHGAGDVLLVSVATRMRGAVRPSDVVARLGGDEFGILLAGVSEPADAVTAAERILAACREPIGINGQEVYAAASIGIAFGAFDADPADVLRDADIAMYLAKSQGKNRYELFHPALHADVVRRLALRASLQRGIEHDEFVVHYQPIVDLADGRTVAFEALLRWQHPERGLIGPDEFIPVAEATGLIVPLGRWVLETACRQLVRWVADGQATRAAVMTVNLSPAQLRHPDIVEHVRGALGTSGLAAANLILEVTEGVISDLEEAISVLSAIRELGVGIAIDDFGTGYSALGYLNRLPIDHLKIDRSFVSVLGASDRETALTENVIRLAIQLGLNTVAEGIESREQLEVLRRLGCRLGQGFLFSQPLDADAAGSFGTPAPAPALLRAPTSVRRLRGPRSVDWAHELA
jgi:diguanylate cyclase (GGDEF)-like protein